MNSPEYLSVTNLIRYQHYKKRNPPWVKLHRRFWTDDKIELLTVAERLLFLGCLTLASESGNHFQNNPRWLTKRLNIPVKPVMVTKLLSLQLLTISTAPSDSLSSVSVSDTLSLSKHSASRMIAPRYQDASKRLADRLGSGFESIGSIADKVFPPKIT